MHTLFFMIGVALVEWLIGVMERAGYLKYEQEGPQ